MPKSSTPEQKKRRSDLWDTVYRDAESRELAAKSGFQFVFIGTGQMDAFMKERTQNSMEMAERMGLVK